MTKKIQEIFCKWLASSGHEAICENYGYNWEMDIASLRNNGMLHEFEVKISRSDFLADKKNKAIKFQHYEIKNIRTAPNYFSYVCPNGLIKENEIPPYAGLYYVLNEEIVLIKKAKKIHKEKLDSEMILKKMLRLNIQRKYLGGSMLTYLNRKSVELYNEGLNLNKNESIFTDKTTNDLEQIKRG